MITMIRIMKKSISAMLSLLLIIALLTPQAAKAAEPSDNPTLNKMIGDTVQFYQTNRTTLSSWWQIVALWGAGENLHDGRWILPDWEKTDPKFSATAGGTDHIQKIFGLLALGHNPANAWETKRNLYAELAAQQNATTGAIGGINKHIWAMLALDTGKKLGHDVGTWNQAAKEKAVNYTLSQQLSDGGFALSGSISDTDITGMVLLALGNYQSDSAVAAAIERAKAFLKQVQLDNGGFDSIGPWGSGDNSNSLSTAVSGLVAIGENVLATNWIINDHTVLDSFRSFQRADGSFIWKLAYPNTNLASTEQALIALLDIQHNKSVWYRLAEQPTSRTVQLSVDGLNGTIFEQQSVTTSIYNNPVTAMAVLKQALDKAAPPIDYVIEESDWGPYLKAIAGVEAGSLGGWDGWMYEVNGIEPQVGASDYQLQENDVVKFYYSRWPSISTTAQIESGTINPTLHIKLVGDIFTPDAHLKQYWSFDPRATGLAINSIAQTNNQEIVITFIGKSRPGVLDLQALPAALGSGTASNIVNVNVSRTISSTVDQTFAVDEQETEISVVSNPTGQVFNSVTFTFTKPELPKISAIRGSTHLEIPLHATITSTWDQTLQLPINLTTSDSSLTDKLNAALSSSGKKLDSIDFRITVGGESRIQFDRHVTLILKGFGDKEAGFIDEHGQFTSIPKYGDNSPRTDEAYAYNDQGDLIIKTKHFTEFLAYLAALKEVPGDGGGGSVPPAKVVTLSVEKRSIDEGDIVEPITVTLLSGDTAFTLLKRVLDNRSIALAYSGSEESLYVKAIDNLSEFDKGPESGWMYTVNGSFPNKSAGSYSLNNGDVVRWQYTKDLGKDIGNKVNTPSTSVPTGIGGSVPQPKPSQTAEIEQVIKDSGNWILKNQNFSVYESNHDWDVIALARSGRQVPNEYYKALEGYTKEKDGIFRLVTDYERMVLAATAIGKDPTNVAGHNFIELIYNNERMTQQGTNGPVFALLALDANAYEVPANALWTREKLLQWIVDQQNEDGGFAISTAADGQSDIDLTAMTLQALSNYQDRTLAKAAADKAIAWLSKQQLPNGGFKAWGEESSESISQVIIALSSLGIGLDDKRFVKGQGDLLTALKSFTNSDGGFSHVRGSSSDRMATQQALLAFAAYERQLKGKAGLYDYKDVTKSNSEAVPSTGYGDVAAISDWALAAVTKATALGFMNGTGSITAQFEPQRELTRAEFAALIVRYTGGVSESAEPQFQDVSTDSWYYDYVATAKAKGLISGVATNTFAPDLPITRQEMATIIVRMKGLPTQEQPLEGPQDQETVSTWALPYVNEAYESGLMTGDGGGYFRPLLHVTREMAAVVMIRLYELHR